MQLDSFHKLLHWTNASHRDWPPLESRRTTRVQLASIRQSCASKAGMQAGDGSSSWNSSRRNPNRGANSQRKAKSAVSYLSTGSKFDPERTAGCMMRRAVPEQPSSEANGKGNPKAKGWLTFSSRLAGERRTLQLGLGTTRQPTSTRDFGRSWDGVFGLAGVQ
jgi:hypothetical protein